MMIIFRPAALIVTMIAVLSSITSFAHDSISPRSRPFLMGFTLWPSDMSLDGLNTAQDFAYSHGDIIAVPLINGIPWPEALDGKPFSKDVESKLSYHPPAGKKLFLSISPLSEDRSGMAPYWGEKDNQPLPKPWDTLPFNSPQVKKAYLNFVLHAVNEMKPDYLAIGIELNAFLSKNPAKWPSLKELYRETYSAVKRAHPSLPVFFTTDVLHYKKLMNEAADKDQEGEVAALMEESDLFAMSVYPYMSYAVPLPVPGDFLDFAKKFNKPIAVSESGMASRDVILTTLGLTLHGSEADQSQFTALLLSTASRDKYKFVINFATTDFEKLCEKLPEPAKDIGLVWAYTGMQTSDKKPKPALAVWDDYYRSGGLR